MAVGEGGGNEAALARMHDIGGRLVPERRASRSVVEIKRVRKRWKQDTGQGGKE